MTYSWYNIGEQYKNNKIKFGVSSPKKGDTNTFDITYYPIEFSPVSYTYEDINEYIQHNLILNGKPKDAIKLEIDFGRFKCKLTIKAGYVLDLTKSTFCDLIGFEENVYGFTNKLEDFTQWGIKTPNITNSIDNIYIHCDLINNSVVDGNWGNVLYTLSTANLLRSYPFTIEPRRVGFSEINKYNIDSITIHMTDVNGRIINLNGVNVSLYLIIKENR